MEFCHVWLGKAEEKGEEERGNGEEKREREVRMPGWKGDKGGAIL